jgi:hypothetical protein
MVDEPLDESYFIWLCAKVLPVESPIYWDLMRILYKTEFVWVLPRDKNRADDGRELRLDFFRESYLKKDLVWYNQPVSVLETLIAFANRAYFQTDMPINDWFWQFITNLDLSEYRQVSKSALPVVEDILQTFIWRTYDPSGHGGLFPMRWPKQDQRKVEIWYQFCEYIVDQAII